MIAEALAFGNHSFTSSHKTLEMLSYAYIEALSLLTEENKIEIPDGLYTEKQGELIKKASRDINNTQRSHHIPLLVDIVWAYAVSVNK